MHYFDYAATTKLSKTAKNAMMKELEEAWFNSSAQYEQGVEQAKRLEHWKHSLATSLGCEPSEFCFTSCGTEGNNWAISQGAYLGRHRGKHCITSSVEHSSVLESMKALEARGYTVTYLKPNKYGLITPEQVADALKEDTILVSLMMVNNETGVIFPVKEIFQKVKAFNPNIVTHCDAVQGFLKIPFTMHTGKAHSRLLNIDLLSISGHKVFGPQGIGGMFIRKGLKLAPLLRGGGQENGMRSGTPASHQIAGFATAVEEGLARFPDVLDDVAEIKENVIHEISHISTVKLLIPEEVPTAPHILPFALVGYPSQVVVRYLSDRGICVSAGSACHRGGDSHVFSALSLEKKELVGALRLSFSHETTQEDVGALVQALAQASVQLFPSM